MSEQAPADPVGAELGLPAQGIALLEWQATPDRICDLWREVDHHQVSQPDKKTISADALLSHPTPLWITTHTAPSPANAALPPGPRRVLLATSATPARHAQTEIVKGGMMAEETPTSSHFIVLSRFTLS